MAPIYGRETIFEVICHRRICINVLLSLLLQKNGVKHSKISAIADLPPLLPKGLAGVKHSKISAIADSMANITTASSGVKHS